MTRAFAFFCFGVAAVLTVYVLISVVVMWWRGRKREHPQFVSSVLRRDTEAAALLDDARLKIRPRTAKRLARD